MLEANSPVREFDIFGRFPDRADEQEFLINAWPEDRVAFEIVAWVAAGVFLVEIVFNFFVLSFGTPQFIISSSISLICALAAIGFAVAVRSNAGYRNFGFAGFCQELLIITGYLVIANLVPEFIHMQSGVLAVTLIFVWFFVPLHPHYSLASTAVIIAGFCFLHFRHAPGDMPTLFLALILFAGIITMGLLSVRSKDRLRRSNYRDQRNLELANENLRNEVKIRKAAESKEAASRERFEGIFQASPMPLVLSELENGNILMINAACCDLLGRAEDEIVGRHHKYFIDVTDAYVELDRQVTMNPGTVSTELPVKRADGTMRDCVISAVRFSENSGQSELVLTGLYDVTERKDFERNLVAARLEAESAQRSQSQFLATMSHEIRTPLNALLGFLQIVELDDISDTVRGNLSLARQSGQHLLRLITDILDLSRLTSDNVEIELTDVDCKALCREAIETFRISAAEKGVELRVECQLSNQHYEMDEVRIRQVMFNLIGNAIKFTPQGEVTLSVSETTDGPNGGNFLIFEVRDSGIGIDPDKVELIFQEFTQADASTTRKYGGTGLGLAISQKLVDVMGGRIGVHKNQPNGSVFWFSIPASISRASQQDGDKIADGTVQDRADTSTETILIAEDNEMNQRVICAFVKSLGYEYELVGNGQDAIEKLANRDFSLVLMDIQMPVLDGLSAIRFIRSGATQNPDIPIVAVTANAMASDRETYIRAGANAYLAKPITLEILKATISELSGQTCHSSVASSSN